MNNQVTKILETNCIAAIESQITKITCQNQATISDLTSKAMEVSANSTKLGSPKDQLENLEAPVTTLLTNEDTTTVDPANPLGNNSINSITRDQSIMFFKVPIIHSSNSFLTHLLF